MLEHTINWNCHTECVNKVETTTFTRCNPAKKLAVYVVKGYLIYFSITMNYEHFHLTTIMHRVTSAHATDNKHLILCKSASKVKPNK